MEFFKVFDSECETKWNFVCFCESECETKLKCVCFCEPEWSFCIFVRLSVTKWNFKKDVVCFCEFECETSGIL